MLVILVLSFLNTTMVKKYIFSTPGKILILQIGDFAAQIENDPGGVITGIKVECDWCKILCLVVGSNFLDCFREISKVKVEVLWDFLPPMYLMCAILSVSLLVK